MFWPKLVSTGLVPNNFALIEQIDKRSFLGKFDSFT